MSGRTSAAPDPHALISALAARQHGVVARRQLLGAGIAGHRIDFRVKRGRLVSLHRGVYLVGPVAPPRAREMAAVLACGSTAALSHRTAAACWKHVPPEHPRDAVHVSIRRGSRSHGPGIRVHRVSRLGPTEITILQGMPITTPPRTLMDLASCVGSRELERALARARREHPGIFEILQGLLDRHPGRTGTPALRRLLGPEGVVFIRSAAEARFLDLVREARLRIPEVNVIVRGFEVDFLWRREGLIVEIDGLAHHGSPAACERDRRRDAVLAAAGFRTISHHLGPTGREPDGGDRRRGPGPRPGRGADRRDLRDGAGSSR